MATLFVNPVVGPDTQLGIRPFDDTDPVRLWEHASAEEAEIVIRAVYRQVLGNAYVMESERLTVAESQLKRGEISVREFVRAVAKSELYRSRFFENCPRSRAIELNFKHLLGRAPESYEETAIHSQLLDQEDYGAEIDAYLDSDEYQDAFGEEVVPYYRGYRTQPGKKMVGFTHLFELLRGASSSDKNLVSGNRTRLNSSLLRNAPSKITPVTGASYPWRSPLVASSTDMTQLLATTLQSSSSPVVERSVDPPKVQAQTQQIAILEATLADLRPAATIGAAVSGGGSMGSPILTTREAQALQATATAQAAYIASLQEQIADARRLAAVGEYRLNKWRSRTFNR
jgi:phycoerythrin-associated linker protein